jgi:hypothetical protein
MAVLQNVSWPAAFMVVGVSIALAWWLKSLS